jgi:hypothetical protein
MAGSIGLPAPYKVDTGGTNVYGTVDTAGADARQIQMLRMLTGGRNMKKGGAPLAPQTIDGGRIIVPQFPNGGTASNAIMTNLTQIAGQAQANSAFDQAGGRRRKTKKTKRSRKKRRGQKKTRRRRK